MVCVLVSDHPRLPLVAAYVIDWVMLQLSVVATSNSDSTESTRSSSLSYPAHQSQPSEQRLTNHCGASPHHVWIAQVSLQLQVCKYHLKLLQINSKIAISRFASSFTLPERPYIDTQHQTATSSISCHHASKPRFSPWECSSASRKCFAYLKVCNPKFSRAIFRYFTINS